MSKSIAVSDAPSGLPAATKGVFWAVVVTCLVVSSLAFGAPVTPSFIYGIDDAKNLWVMNLDSQTSGTLFQAFFSGTGEPNGLAYDSGRNDLYAVDSSNNLYWWRQGATNFSLIASGSTLGIGSGNGLLSTQPWGAAYYDNAYWFFQGSGVSDTLLGSNILEKVSLDYSGGTPTVSSVTTFVATAITGSNSFGDIAITPGGTLFAYTTSGDFYSLDLTTAGGGTVGGYSLINTTSGTGLQIAFGSDNTTLYGHNFADSSWYTVNTSNGTLTSITSPAPGRSFRDLGGSAVQAVPEPSTMVLAALGGAIVAWRVARRRRRTRDGGPRDSGDSDGPPLAESTVVLAA